MESGDGGSVNKVILIGNLGADPEIKRTPGPPADRQFADRDLGHLARQDTGVRKEGTEWHRVVIFSEGFCKIAEQYLKKGAKVYIEGQLQTRKWIDQTGVEKYSTEVVLQNFNSTLTMLDGRSGGVVAISAAMISAAISAPWPIQVAAPPRCAAGARNNDMDEIFHLSPPTKRCAGARPRSRAREQAGRILFCWEQAGAGSRAAASSVCTASSSHSPSQAGVSAMHAHIGAVRHR